MVQEDGYALVTGKELRRMITSNFFLKKIRIHTWTMATSSSLAMRFGSSRSPVAPGTTSSGGTSVIFGEASLGDTVYDVWLDL